nr:MAG TPA: hypothetical protein [Caudoviricetes sp.]DAQ15529.1 MAG TPA: hypothetical protein [Caudoviricetes sp.]
MLAVLSLFLTLYSGSLSRYLSVTRLSSYLYAMH